ncbi:hypothetical protein AXG93_1154s1640 [Marchantia polymorpha subsp. ruderalis]|uniref:Uncharacterized protein n=1 Tax=Marchantia polymorpha subsp. ruderalis TaxID=1480154 RepID=A0A176WRH4_MARPO|nr:hypothetical protein AXG93_1154s1640 [Marchantia polymorpha subsp. ruderalis]
MEGDDASMLRMEGDDASMLSPAAELETQGMKVEGRMEGDDQLPLRVQDFLQLLPFHFRRGSVLLNLLDLRSEVSDFFPNVRHRIATDGRRGQVRLRVLEAIGSCFSSYEGLDVGDICGRNISRLTASEWEVVLRGFRSSSVLREMKISQLKWSSEADLESLGLQLGIILNTSSVTDLTIQYCTLTERFFLNLASGPLENSHSKLKSLQVGGVWGDGVNAMKFILEVLTGHHQLETLSLSSILGGQGGVEAAVRLLPQGLKQNSCLKELVLQKVEGGSAALLLNALAGDDGNRSIERLQLAYMSGIGKCLAEVFISNRSLRVVTLEDIDMPVEECRLLGEAIRDNDTATTVKVISTLTLELEELSRAASSHRKEPVLHLELIFCHYNQVTSGLNLLGSLLGGEIKSVKYFRLLDIYSKDIMKVILSMNGSTGEFSVLSKLQLDSEREDVFSGIWNQLLRVRENTSVTSLSLDLDEQNEEFKDRGFEKEFRDIMALLRVNLTLREIDVSNTPWASDGRAALIEAALKQNRERAVYMSVFTEAKLPLGDAKAGRLFLCGSPKAAMGQNFQAQESKAYKKTMPYNSFARKEGFMSEADFSLLIDTFLEKHPRLQDVDRKVLENIIFNLDLGYKLEDSFQYFIPSFIPEYASMEEQKQQEGASVVSMSWNSKVANPNFVGIRIRCEDLKTMTLSAAFFPRFQSEKCHNYVDVLILCSEEENKSKEEAIRYVLKHVVQELISFCASSEGCPGVALVRGVIQTVCVEKLHRSHLRGTILIEELKSKFSTSINDKLEDESQPVKEEELLHYEYTWPEIPKLHLKPTSERVTNLLWKRDVDEVVNGILQKRNQQLKSLQDSRNRLDNYLAQSHTDSESAVSNSSLPHRKDCNPASASCLSKASTSADTQLLLSEIHSVHETIKSMKGIVEGLDVKLGQVISLQQQLQSTFCDLMSKVDRMIGYSESHQQARTPKRPYITDDVGIFYKMSAFLHAGTIVTLHLMCENVTGFHAVKDQKGLKLRLNKENSGWIPRIIEISYKVLYYVVKAGLSSTLGLGDAIPQWNDLLTDIAKLDDISQPDGRAIRKGVRSEELNEAWLRIQETLARRLKDDYSKIFKLYPVKYVRQQNGGHAWIRAKRTVCCGDPETHITVTWSVNQRLSLPCFDESERKLSKNKPVTKIGEERHGC